MATKQKKSDKKDEKKKQPSNLGLGSLKGAMNPKNRKARMDAYLENATGSKKKSDKKKK